MEGEGEGRKGKEVSGQAREKRAARAPRFSLTPQTAFPFAFKRLSHRLHISYQLETQNVTVFGPFLGRPSFVRFSFKRRRNHVL